MKREFVQWLRGDAIKGSVDIYFHIDPKDVQEGYLASIPQLGIYCCESIFAPFVTDSSKRRAGSFMPMAGRNLQRLLNSLLEML